MYQGRARHLAALHLLIDHKIEAVALLVGYKSKKNFYRVFERSTKQTPSAFRRLSPHAQSRIIDAAERALDRVF